MFKTNHGVIVACDVKTLEELEKLVRATSSVRGVVGYKIGFILGLGYGLKNVVSAIKEITSMPIIYDHQKAGTDIPAMGIEFAAAMKRAGVDSAIIFPQAGPKTEEAFITALKQEGVIPMVHGEMTSQFLQKDGGFVSDDSPGKIYEIAARLGVEYFIAPGNKPDSTKRYMAIMSRFVKPKICMPGIGRQGGGIATAFAACGENPAYAIIGMAIYSADDVTAAAKKFCEEAMKFE